VKYSVPTIVIPAEVVQVALDTRLSSVAQPGRVLLAFMGGSAWVKLPKKQAEDLREGDSVVVSGPALLRKKEFRLGEVVIESVNGVATVAAPGEQVCDPFAWLPVEYFDEP